MISKKFQKILLNFLIFFLVIGSISLFLGHKVLNKNFEVLLKQYQTTLAGQIFKTIEQDILVNNYRAATQKLNNNFTQNDLSLITAVRDKNYSKTIYLGNIKDSHLYQIVKIPLYYDHRKENKWGDIEFHFNDSSLSESKSFLNIFFISNQTLTLLFVTIIFYFLFKNFRGSFNSYNKEALKIIKDPNNYKEEENITLNDEVLKNLHGLAIEVNNKNNELKEKAKQEEAVKISRQLAHDIRSPISALDTISEDISFKSSSDIDIFNKSIQRVKDIANNLLNVKKERSSSSEGISNIIEEIINEKSIDNKISFEVIHNCESFQVDSFEFKRIISNLLNNSIESKANEIKLETFTNTMFNNISIKDNGSGINKEVLEKLNSKGDTVSTKDAGHGLGTEHAKSYLEKIGGKISFTSDGKSQTEVLISIPLNNVIVHLEDDLLTSEVWKSRASKAGVNLLSFSSYKDLSVELDKLDFNTKFYIDYDLEFDEMNGLEICEDLYNKGYTNLTLSTGHQEEEFGSIPYVTSIIGKKCPF